MLSSIANFFTGKKNTLPTTNTRRVTGAPANATVINVARPEQQQIPSRSVSPSFNTSTGAGATAPVIKNMPNNAVAINMQGPGMLGGRRKSKKSKSKKAKKAKKATHRK